MQLLARAARDTSDMSARTLDRVSGLRADVMNHLHKQDTALAVVEGKLDLLIDELAVTRRERSEILVSRVQAEIEVNKTGEIALIDEAADKRKHRRAVLLKIVAIVGPIVSAIIAALAAGGC